MSIVPEGYICCKRMLGVKVALKIPNTLKQFTIVTLQQHFKHYVSNANMLYRKTECHLKIMMTSQLRQVKFYFNTQLAPMHVFTTSL